MAIFILYCQENHLRKHTETLQLKLWYPFYPTKFSEKCFILYLDYVEKGVIKFGGSLIMVYYLVLKYGSPLSSRHIHIQGKCMCK